LFKYKKIQYSDSQLSFKLPSYSEMSAKIGQGMQMYKIKKTNANFFQYENK